MMNNRSSSPSYNNIQNPYNSYSSSILPPSFTSIEEEQHHQPWHSSSTTTQNHHLIADTGFGVANADHPAPLAIPMNSVGSSSRSFPANYFSPNLEANQYPSFIKREEGGGGSRIGLNLGHRTYFSSGDALTIDRLLTARAHQGQLQAPRCQAEGCKADLSGAKHYHKRHKVCEYHSKATAVITSGLQQRFCQQCSRFHVLSEFDESKRSCRKRLADHNRRRRKPQNLSDKTKHYSSSSSKSGTTTSATNSNGYEGNQGNKNKSTSSVGVLGEASQQQQHIQYNYAQHHNYNLSSPNPANINSNGDNYYSQNFFASSSNNGVYHSSGDGNNAHLGQPIYEVDFM